MPRDGSGAYSLPEAAFVFDTIISETAMNSNLSDMATALTASIAKDGQTNPTANLPMNSKKHTGVAVGTTRTDYADVGSVADGDYLWCGTAGGTADAITLTPSPSFTALVTGMKLRWKASANANTGAATAVISGLTSIAVEINDAALAAGQHAANKYYEGLYDGTALQIQKISGVIGDLLASLNLSDIADGPTARGNIGAGTVTSVATSGLATGGAITDSGTVTVAKATGAEINTGTEDAKAATPKAIADAVGSSLQGYDATIPTGRFTSSEQTVAVDTKLEIPHGLGARPNLIQLTLKCVDAGGDGGYAQNDEVIVNAQGPYESNNGVVILVDSTNITLIQGSSFRLLGKTSFNDLAITPSKWRWIARTWE